MWLVKNLSPTNVNEPVYVTNRYKQKLEPIDSSF